MRTFTIPGTVLAALAMSGCTVGPDYQRPKFAAPTNFRGQADVAARSAKTPASLEAWWDGFDDPTLSRLIVHALDSNLDVAQAMARVAQARASLRGANAALLPSGTISANAAHAHQSLETPLGRLLDGTPGFDRDAELYDATAGVSWEVDLFGGLRRDREATRAEYDAANASVAASRLAISAQTADTYMVARGLQTRVAIALDQVKTQRQLMMTIKLQYEKGIAAELQFRQAEGALAQVQATVPVLESALEAALNALDVLAGDQPGSNRAWLTKPEAVPSAPSIADAGGPAELLRRRPDLIVAERRLAASNARIGSAISQYYPKFSLSALLGTATISASGLLSGSANQAQGVLGLRWRIFDFGRVDAEIAGARGLNAEALAAYRLAALRASQDVEDSFSALVKREAQEQLLAGGEASLARARTASYAAYKGGVVSLIEVLDADNRLLATRDARAQARTEAARAAVGSFRALGGGWKSEAL